MHFLILASNLLFNITLSYPEETVPEILFFRIFRVFCDLLLNVLVKG